MAHTHALTIRTYAHTHMHTYTRMHTHIPTAHIHAYTYAHTYARSVIVDRFDARSCNRV